MRGLPIVSWPSSLAVHVSAATHTTVGAIRHGSRLSWKSSDQSLTRLTSAANVQKQLAVVCLNDAVDNNLSITAPMDSLSIFAPTAPFRFTTRSGQSRFALYMPSCTHACHLPRSLYLSPFPPPHTRMAHQSWTVCPSSASIHAAHNRVYKAAADCAPLCTFVISITLCSYPACRLLDGVVVTEERAVLVCVPFHQ